ncbi:uncharacterized protein A4U43_C02F12990 [Asparagus officinalis]|uniref:PB1 domain-containing protein n=1 Tax=Asparagus officinalis TaxID=4686 RepID=A0A5P1FJT8_ASPOF|nr:uncharacterized protein A4U43_C02F12990 [Asparagus officinalis]
MGKPTTKKKKGSVNGKSTDSTNIKHNSSPKMFDEDTTIFIDMSQDMKEEGNKIFQKRDYEGAVVLYEKAIKLLPKNHTNIAYLRSNLAACYMHMVPSEFRQAINECNLALEASSNYSKALLKRARCYEALNRFESACKDIDSVLALEPNNITALEILERIKLEMEKKGIMLDDKEMVPPLQIPIVSEKTVKEKSKRKKSHKVEDKVFSEIKSFKKEKPMKIVKLVFGEDIRCVQLPECCSIMQVKEVVRNRFPRLKAIFVKYKDKEGDLITITTTEELRWAEESADPQGSMRLYIVEVNNNNMEHESFMSEEGAKVPETARKPDQNFFSFSDSGSMKYSEAEGPSPCIDNWIIQFARLFKNHVGINSDACLDLHELGMKLYSEAIEDATTSEEA